MSQFFDDIAQARGWSPQTQVDILLEYIENQQSDEAFLDFIEEQERVQPKTLAVELGQRMTINDQGQEEEFGLLEEVGTGNVFAVHGSYLEQDGEVSSPYGNGVLQFRDVESEVDGELFHTTYEVHVLSDWRLPADMPPSEMEREITTGGCVGRVLLSRQRAVSREAMHTLLENFDSDPAFLLGEKED